MQEAGSLGIVNTFWVITVDYTSLISTSPNISSLLVLALPYRVGMLETAEEMPKTHEPQLQSKVSKPQLEITQKKAQIPERSLDFQRE